MRYIGIDPGAKGGIAWIDECADGMLADALPMPATVFDIVELMVSLTRTQQETVACIEYVASRPGQGVSSTFKFGMNFGQLLAALAAAEIRHQQVTPSKWQSAFGLPSENKAGSRTAKKNVHKAKAQQFFPDLKITHSTADALLLAEYCLRNFS